MTKINRTADCACFKIWIKEKWISLFKFDLLFSFSIKILGASVWTLLCRFFLFFLLWNAAKLDSFQVCHPHNPSLKSRSDETSCNIRFVSLSAITVLKVKRADESSSWRKGEQLGYFIMNLRAAKSGQVCWVLKKVSPGLSLSLLLPCLDLILVYMVGRMLLVSRHITVWSPVNHPTNKPPAVNRKPHLLSCVVSMLCSRSTLSKHIWTHQWVRHTPALNTALHYEEYRHRQVKPSQAKSAHLSWDSVRGNYTPHPNPTTSNLLSTRFRTSLFPLSMWLNSSLHPKWCITATYSLYSSLLFSSACAKTMFRLQHSISFTMQNYK